MDRWRLFLAIFNRCVVAWFLVAPIAVMASFLMFWKNKGIIQEVVHLSEPRVAALD